MFADIVRFSKLALINEQMPEIDVSPQVIEGSMSGHCSSMRLVSISRDALFSETHVVREFSEGQERVSGPFGGVPLLSSLQHLSHNVCC